MMSDESFQFITNDFSRTSRLILINRVAVEQIAGNITVARIGARAHCEALLRRWWGLLQYRRVSVGGDETGALPISIRVSGSKSVQAIDVAIEHAESSGNQDRVVNL